MRLATSDQIREIDSLSVKVYGLSAEVLMEAAGTLAAREIQLSYFPELSRGETAVVCGPGNNGGDGLVVARHLHAMGFRDLTVFILAGSKKQSPMFKLQKKRAELQGLRLIDLSKNFKKIEAMKTATLIVDAIFGIGAERRMQGDYSKLIEKINSVKVPKVALDLPSGLSADRGIVLGAAVRADMTLTMGLPKPGFFVGEGPAHVGKLRTLSIGFPFELMRGIPTTHFLFNEKLAKRYLPKRRDTDSKADHGRLVVAAGSSGKWGAGVLACHAAFRMGTGYLYWSSNDSPANEIGAVPEAMIRDLDDPELWDPKRINAWVVGPGLGVSNKTRDLIIKLKKAKFPNVVLDADALTVAVKEKMFPLPESWVVTPHAGELSKIIGLDSMEIEADRFEAAKRGTAVTGCHVLLKGYRSILAYKGRCLVINSGNSSLAKAGTGDVLAGMIGALMAQGLDTVQATATAAYVHGRLADEWLRKGNDRNALMASDIYNDLPGLLSRVASSVVF